MISSFRNFSKSKLGTAVMALVLVLILVGFAAGDIQNVLSGGSIGTGKNVVAEAGGEDVTVPELDAAMRLRLAQLRREDPTAGNEVMSRDLEPMLESMIQAAALRDFARSSGIILSNRLIDAQIAQIPGTRGLDGKFSTQSYNAFLAQQQMTDPQFRELIGDQLLERLMLAPASAGVRTPVGIARPYASMQLEQRTAEIVSVPVAAMLGKIGQPSDAQVQAFYNANGRRYMVPEQRVLDIVRIGPDQVANVTPSQADIAAYYKANQALYGGKAQRVISRAVVADAKVAATIAAKLKAGTSFVDAAKPAGFSAADISLGPQTREEFTRLTSPEIAAAVFAPNVREGAVVGPLRSDLGYIVVKVDRMQQIAGKSLDATRAEITAKLVGDKRKEALQNLVAKLEDSVIDGASIGEAAKAAGLTVTKTSAITASGGSLTDKAYRFPAELAPALRAGFQLDQDEEPTVAILKEGEDYALVGLDQLVSAAPAPLATIRDRVAADWRAAQAREQARTISSVIAGKIAKGVDPAKAVAEGGVALPPIDRPTLRRLQMAQLGGKVPPSMRMMFSLAKGRSRMVADPSGAGFVIVKVTNIVPGDASLQPALIAQLQREFDQAIGNELAEQFVKAIQAEVKVTRNPAALETIRRQYGSAN